MVAASPCLDRSAAKGMTWYYVVTEVDTAGNESGHSRDVHAAR